jgi:hypothetical protein
MKNSIVFDFTDGTKLSIQFELTNENVGIVANAIGEEFQKRVQLLNSQAAKYLKKSNVLPCRKVKIAFLTNGTVVRTSLSNVEVSNGLLKDFSALTEVLELMFLQVVEAEKPEICMN